MNSREPEHPSSPLKGGDGDTAAAPGQASSHEEVDDVRAGGHTVAFPKYPDRGGGRLAAVTADTPESDKFPASWEEVARDYGQMLYALAFRLTGNQDDARDLVQDVLIKVNRSLASFKPGSFSGWLYRISVNTFLDNVRRNKRVRLQPIPDDLSRFADGDLAPEPHEMLRKTRLDDELQAALNDLPPEFKAAVVMCDVLGLSYEEIAQQLDVALGTVRSRIHRGRALLRRRLAHRLGEG